MKIVQHKEATNVDDSGDILYPFEDWTKTKTGNSFYSKFYPELLKRKSIILLDLFNNLTWVSLEMLGIENVPITAKKVSYEDPYSRNNYFWFFPRFILCDNPSVYLDKQPIWRHKSILSMGYKFRQGVFESGTFPMHDIGEIFLGHGYTEGTLPSDGFGIKHDTVIALDNEDLIAGKVWVWYNK